MTACRCWGDTYALGHDGHCCFVHGDRKVGNGFKDDADICHASEALRLVDRFDPSPLECCICMADATRTIQTRGMRMTGQTSYCDEHAAELLDAARRPRPKR